MTVAANRCSDDVRGLFPGKTARWFRGSARHALHHAFDPCHAFVDLDGIVLQSAKIACHQVDLLLHPFELVLHQNDIFQRPKGFSAGVIKTVVRAVRMKTSSPKGKRPL